MENFVLYENLGKREHVTIYKGRRKGTIHFVAIHCIDKCKRPEVTNTVRMTHDVSHNNIVQFYEWYETSNHLWLVVELCTGGTLSSLIKQDGCLPESSVRTFGLDLVTGLHYIHSLGIIFNDLQPSKILLDTTGALKYGDFGLSKGEGENLAELFHGFADAGEQWNPENMEEVYNNIVTTGSPSYTAPEIFQGREPNVMTDLWSLGCVFYELFTGHPPFLAETLDQLKEKIMTQDFPPPKVRGSRFSAKPSPDYLSLLQGLLQKDLTRRLGWAGLVNHPFWQNKLTELAKDLTTVSQDVTSSDTFTGRSSIFEHRAGSVLGKIKGLDLLTDRPTSRLDTADGTRPGSTLGEYLRPKTAPGSDGGESLFTLSARPHTASAHDERVASPFRTVQSPLATRELINKDNTDDTTDGTTNELLQNIFHSSDFILTSIIDNPKIQKAPSQKYDVKTLPVPPYNVEKLMSLPEKDFSKHLKLIVENLGSGEKGPPSQKRLHLLNYTASIAVKCKITTELLQNNALLILAKQTKDTQHVEMKIKMARVMALVALNSEQLDENINISEPITILSEIIRENVKNSKIKLGLLPAVGEMLYFVASQDRSKESSCENWSVPSMTYSVISRSCRDGEDAVVNHVAAKTVENIVSIKGPHALKFVSSEMGQILWYLFKHSTLDSIRCTAMSALCRIIWQNASVFQNVIDTVGLTTILSSLSLGISRVQQAVITMIGALVGSGLHLNRLLQDRDFLPKIMRLFESPSTVIRAKAFMVLHELTKSSSELLLSACNARLVMYIERDSRRQTPREPRSESPDVVQYLNQALDKLINHITDSLPTIIKEILGALESVSGRKHPSANQTRQLKSTLPLLPVGLHLVTSQVFRSRVVNEEFIKDLGSLLNHVNQIENKETNIEASSAAIGTTEFINTVMSILEGISQHPSLLIQYHHVVIETILPSLATLIKSQNADTKVLSLRMLSEIACVYLNQDQYAHNDNKVNSDRLHQIITQNLLTQFEAILLDMDPLPGYGLKLLLSLLEQNSNFITEFRQQGLIPVIFQVLQDHNNNPSGTTMQNLVSIINCLILNKQTNLQELYDQGLIDHLTTVFFEVSSICFEGEESGQDIKSSTTMLQIILDTLHNILKYVSDIVRKALQAKKSGASSANKEAEWAEQLLMFNKPLTDMTSDLTQLLCYDDSDIYDISVKSLSLLIQLYGGEHKNAMSTENMAYYSRALKKADVKKQKIILRVIKRLVGTDSKHCEKMKVDGELLANTIKSLVHTASSHADVGMTSLAAEILKTTGHL